MLPPKEQMEQMKREQQERFQPADESRAVQFGPPSFGNEEVYNEDDLQDAYKNFDEPQLEELYPDDVEPEEDGPVPSFGFNPPPNWGNREEEEDVLETPSLRQEGGAFLREEALFPGGPSRSEVMSWKKQFEQDGHTVNLHPVGEETFIWRSLSRTEYREIMALPNTDPIQREEIICEVCTLFPYEYNFTSMANRKAGVPAVLAEAIMKESGFAKTAPPIRL